MIGALNRRVSDANHTDNTRLLETIKQHLSESRLPPPETLDLDSSLRDDLGFDSLSRVELITRLEQSFNVTLPDYVVISAETPRDLLRAIRSAFPQKPAAASPAARPSTEQPPHDNMVQPPPGRENTLVDVLLWHVHRHPHRPHLRICDAPTGKPITFAQLYDRAKTIAAGLQKLGIQPGEAVSIMLPTSEDYFFSFFGILLAGGIPVPLYPPANPAQLEDHMRRHVGILSNCQAPVLITVSVAKKIARLMQGQVATLQRVVTVEELAGYGHSFREVAINPQSTAFIQYTSGSTGNPKGVVLSHANLLANIRAMGETINVSPQDVFVSWLPLYHDMGLIGAWLGSVYFGYFFAVMSPITFLRHPEKWLWAIHEFKGTLSASPNFGYELCIRRINTQQLARFDLSHWRAAFNGAETVSAYTMERFYEKFQHSGLKWQALMPVYGLAENSLGLAFPPLDRGMLVDSIKREPFMYSGKAIPALPDDHDSLRFVSCGYPIKHHEIRIVDSSDRELPERHQGLLQFQGPSSTSGYFRNSKDTKRLFHGRWLNSGDLAYVADGEIYLTGRVKDIIIHAGRNIYPHELEEYVGNIDGIRAGRVAAFGSIDRHNGTERLVIVAETRETDADRLSTLHRKVSAAVNGLAGTPPDEIVLAPPNTILKTSSGKLRRAASRELFEKGQLLKKRRAAWLQVLHFTAKGVTAEGRKSLNRIIRVVFGLYTRMLFWMLAVLTWCAVMILPTLPGRWTVLKRATTWLVKLSGTPIKLHGAQNLPPQSQACIYVVNHGSYLDGPVIIHLLPRIVRFVVKSELKRQRLSRWFLNRVNAQYVERFDMEKSLTDLDGLCRSAVQGHSLVFFPEGTFIKRAGLLPFHLGAFVVAVKANIPVIPLTIRGTRAMLRADTWLPNQGTIQMYIGKAIHPNKMLSLVEAETAQGKVKTMKNSELWEFARKLRDAARQQILATCGEPDLISEPRPRVKS